MAGSTWTQWKLVKGTWTSVQVDGPEPSGGKLVWGMTHAGQRVQHLVHDTGSSSTSTTKITPAKPKKKEYQDPESVARLRGMDREALHRRYKTLKGQLARTKDVYKRTRSDAHVLRRNLAKRIKTIEAEIRANYLALYTDEKGRKVHEVYAKGTGRWKALGTNISLTFSSDGKSFSDRLPNIQMGASFWVYAQIEVRRPGASMSSYYSWHPDRLSAYDMVSVQWHIPNGFRAVDAKGSKQDHYMCSNPLHLIRQYRAPDTNPQTGLFRMLVQGYEYTASPGSKWHDEGKTT